MSTLLRRPCPGFITEERVTCYLYLLPKPYVIQCSTNLTHWQDYAWTNIYGDVERWLSAKEIATWRDVTPPAPVKLFRLMARPFP